MARTTIPELTAERVANRLSLLLGRKASGSDVAGGIIDNMVWTLGTVGFNRQVISDVLTDAAKQAEIDPAKVLGEFLPAERSTKRRKSDVSGND